MNAPNSEQPIDPDEARELLAKHEAAAIDIRDPDEAADGHAPGAAVVMGDDVTEAAERARAGKDIPILIFGEDEESCRSAAKTLRDAGIEAAPVKGGWDNWISSGQPVQPRSDTEFEGPDLSAAPGT